MSDVKLRAVRIVRDDDKRVTLFATYRTPAGIRRTSVLLAEDEGVTQGVARATEKMAPEPSP